MSSARPWRLMIVVTTAMLMGCNFVMPNPPLITVPEDTGSDTGRVGDVPTDMGSALRDTGGSGDEAGAPDVAVADAADTIADTTDAKDAEAADAIADTTDVEDTEAVDAIADASDTSRDPARTDSGSIPDTYGDSCVTGCGNGVRETGEICDGDDLIAGVTCASQGFLGGEIGCTDSCELDSSECYDERCGDGVISGFEDCEGTDTFVTCAALGFAPGGESVVACTDACRFDTSDCEDSICGNGLLEIGFEACDQTDFGADSCTARGFVGGTLSCNETCSEASDEGCLES